MKRPIIIGLVFIAVAVSAALVISKRGGEGPSNNDDALDLLIKDLTSTPGAGPLPDYALASKKTEAGYRVAIAISGTLENVPCYCGCGSVGHKSLKDCFIKGEGVFGEHASYCDVCVDEALDVYVWQKQGIPLKEIKSRIEKKYSRYGEPTDTAEV